MGGRTYKSLKKENKRKSHLRKDQWNTVHFLGTSKAKSMWTLMNLRDLSHHVLCCLWIRGCRQSHASSKVNAYNDVFTTERDSGLFKCRTCISGKSVFKMGHILKKYIKARKHWGHRIPSPKLLKKWLLFAMENFYNYYTLTLFSRQRLFTPWEREFSEGLL